MGPIVGGARQLYLSNRYGCRAPTTFDAIVIIANRLPVLA